MLIPSLLKLTTVRQVRLQFGLLPLARQSAHITHGEGKAVSMYDGHDALQR